MIEANLLFHKVIEIEKRMDYVIENLESDDTITSQEVRYICIAYFNDLYKNKKVEYMAKEYLEEKVRKKKRPDIETLLTAFTAALVAGQNYNTYFEMLVDRIKKVNTPERYNQAVHFLLVLTRKIFKKLRDKDKKLIISLVNELRDQDIEKKLFSHWVEKRLFSNSKREEMVITQDQINHLKEYLIWELSNSKEYDNQKEELRKRFIPEILNYNIDGIDWIVLLIYFFIKKDKFHVVTENELNRKIREGVKLRINKKVWFPVGSSTLFLILKLGKENLITSETLIQIALLIFGNILLIFEESLPTKIIKNKKITSEFPATVLLIGVLLWIFGISWTFSLIVSILGNIILWWLTGE